MKVAIPTKSNMVDDHFGHCEYFTVIDIEDNKVLKSVRVESGQTCGCKSNIIVDLKEMGVETMLIGNLGQGAYNKITSKDIKVIGGCSGPVEALIEDYLAGKIQEKVVMCHTHDDGHECQH